MCIPNYDPEIRTCQAEISKGMSVLYLNGLCSHDTHLSSLQAYAASVLKSKVFLEVSILFLVAEKKYLEICNKI
jgi:hypothetical protein